MVPVVSSALELNLILPRIRKTCDAIFEREQVQVDLHLGTMIELPRACLLADQVHTAHRKLVLACCWHIN